MYAVTTHPLQLLLQEECSTAPRSNTWRTSAENQVMPTAGNGDILETEDGSSLVPCEDNDELDLASRMTSRLIHQDRWRITLDSDISDKTIKNIHDVEMKESEQDPAFFGFKVSLSMVVRFDQVSSSSNHIFF